MDVTVSKKIHAVAAQTIGFLDGAIDPFRTAKREKVGDAVPILNRRVETLCRTVQEVAFQGRAVARNQGIEFKIIIDANAAMEPQLVGPPAELLAHAMSEFG
jgi:hypothetical protein